MKTRIIFVFSLYFWLHVFCGTVFSATYYLSPTGSDSNGCTNSTTDACFTPNRARKSVIGISNGDTIQFMNGTYAYSSQISFAAGDGGASGSPITYKAETTGGVIINAGGVARAWEFSGSGGYIVIDGLTFVNFRWGFVNYDDNMTLKNSNFTATTTWPPSGNAINGASGGGCIVSFTGANFLVDNVIADQCTDPTVADNHGIYIDSGTNGIIRNSIFRNNRGCGMNFQAKGDFYGNFTGWKIYNNKIYSNATSTNRHGAYFRGYVGAPSTGCSQFRNNDFYNNLVYSNGFSGWGVVVTVDGGSGCEANINVYNNTVYGNNMGIINQTGAGTIINNIFVNNGSSDITAGTISNGSVTRTTNLTTAGNEGNGVVGSLAASDFVSTNSLDASFLTLKQTATAAIDQGTNVGLTTDFLDKLRPLEGGYDIGAHEYGVMNPSILSITISE